MLKLLLLTTLCISCVSSLSVGVAKVDATPAIGAPLAGYNYPPRRNKWWPLPSSGHKYTTWMNPSTGVWDPLYVKALVIVDGAGTKFCWVTMAFIGVDDQVMRLAYTEAVSRGFSVPFSNVLASASHTHSSAGGISSDFLFSIAPATDLMVPELQNKLVADIASAMCAAEKNLTAGATIDVGETQLYNVTHNRRSKVDHVPSNYVDTTLSVIRIDSAQGTPLATVWGYAIHGICYDAPNMKFTADVLGQVDQWIEDNIGGTAFTVNGAAGDVNPIFSVACQNGPRWSGGEVIGKAVQGVRDTLKPTETLTVHIASEVVDFGNTQLNLTLGRLANCTRGGPLDICSLCTVLKCDDNLQLDASWISNQPKFTAVRLELAHQRNVGIVSVPGEAVTELGFQIRNDTRDLHFDQTFFAGYSNAFLSYFTTPDSYVNGDYESILTLWGINSSAKVRSSVNKVARQVAPHSDEL